jgi:hypothetical protein
VEGVSGWWQQVYSFLGQETVSRLGDIKKGIKKCPLQNYIINELGIEAERVGDRGGILIERIVIGIRLCTVQLLVVTCTSEV